MGRWTALAAGVAAAAAAAGAAIWARRKAEGGMVRPSPRPIRSRGTDSNAKAAERSSTAAAGKAAPTEPAASEPAPTEPVASEMLQSIRGIGAVSEERLRAIGVTSMAQIAAWSSEDVESIAAQIKVSPERIRREDWVGQAQATERG